MRSSSFQTWKEESVGSDDGGNVGRNRKRTKVRVLLLVIVVVLIGGGSDSSGGGGSGGGGGGGGGWWLVVVVVDVEVVEVTPLTTTHAYGPKDSEKARRLANRRAIGREIGDMCRVGSLSLDVLDSASMKHPSRSTELEVAMALFGMATSLIHTPDDVLTSSANTLYTLDTPGAAGPAGSYCEVHGYVQAKEGTIL
ncbi:hypothetical protein HZH66_000119 [Vespula vulgaris]|uniref:Uncharacterized protein n=1 Tax=Vespula vulgaris TaxID=7454 RepID=A0A834KQR7_VESVU|nr:hypothetical protein HZH66_000119 [Vespula vulgaris]